MGFDIRFPIGMLFSLFGILLVGYGVVTRGSEIYTQHSLGLNMNVWWGVVQLGFGMAMLALAWSRRGKEAAGSTRESTKTDRPAARH